MTDELIVVLEDSDEDFDTLLEAYEKTGLQHGIRRAATGDDCLELLHGRGEAAAATFVLLDLNTPGLDGRDVLREIRSDARLKTLPVVVFTTSVSSRDLGLCYELGVNAYHVKPVRYPDHVGVLQQLFTYWLVSVALPHRKEIIEWAGKPGRS